MSIYTKKRVDAQTMELLKIKNMMNAGFMKISKTEYDNLDYFDSEFLLEHEIEVREKSIKEISSNNKRNLISG